MEIRHLRQNEREYYEKIDRYCFIANEEDMKLFFDQRFVPENTLAVFDGDRMAAVLMMIPYQIQWNGQSVPMAGISSVATFPEYRYRGLIDDLLKKSVSLMRERGFLYSFLMPFKYSFYRKYGWGMAFEKQKWECPFDNLKSYIKSGMDYHFRPFDDKDLSLLNEIYNGFTSGKNGALARSTQDWKNDFGWWNRESTPCHRYLATDPDGKPAAYLVYDIKRLEKMHIWEMAYTDRSARQALFRFLYSHNAQAPTLSFYFDDSDPFLFEIDNPRTTCEVIPSMQARSLDNRKVLESLPVEPGLEGSLIIEIDDPVLKENSGRFKLNVSASGVAADSTDENPDLRMPQSVFSPLSLGYPGIEAALLAGKAEMINEKKSELISALFPKRPTTLWDFF